MSIKEHPPQVHVPVLLEKTLEIMQPRSGESYVDLTAGYGGHASAFLQKTGSYETSVLIDRDAYTRPYLENLIEKGSEFRNLDFLSAAQQLTNEGRKFDLILADLGVSSPQLDEPQRGFSFNKQGPLDMRMDNRQQVSAEQIVNTYSENDLVSIICKYGEEPRHIARRIAQAMASARPLHTTDELADLIKATHRGRMKRIHPATRTFQALRIEVNEELAQIEQLLTLLPGLLNPGGRLGVISFHSLEDRLVKRYFSQQVADGLEAELTILTKKPISGATDDVHNPRARSSKFRAAVKK